MKLEMRQLHLRDTFEPRHRNELSTKEKSEVLESHKFLKIKIDGTIKGRAVTGKKNKDNSLARRSQVHPRLRPRRC